jgi:hypothetical protein
MFAPSREFSIEIVSNRFRIIRVRALVPRIAFFGPAAPLRYSRQGFVPSNCSFGPAAPSYYSSAGFGPSNRFLRASSAFVLFECGFRSLKLLSSGQQRLRIIRVRASVPRIAFFGPAAPSYYSCAGFGPSNCLLWASSALKRFEAGLRPHELSFRVSSTFKLFEAGLRSFELSFSAQ